MRHYTTLYCGRLLQAKPAKSKSDPVIIVTPAAIKANAIIARSNRLSLGSGIWLAIVLLLCGVIAWELAKG